MTSKTLEDAIKLACDAHRGQSDKGGAPYILHPLRVMARVDDEPQRIAAVLHDVVEDAGVELGLIRHWFGDEIADAVDHLTRRPDELYSAFIDRCSGNAIARTVKWADLCENMDLSRIPNPTDEDRARVAKYRKAKDTLTAAAFDAQGIVTEGRDGEAGSGSDSE